MMMSHPTVARLICTPYRENDTLKQRGKTRERRCVHYGARARRRRRVGIRHPPVGWNGTALREQGSRKQRECYLVQRGVLHGMRDGGNVERVVLSVEQPDGQQQHQRGRRWTR